jgi:hypothetical protein
MAESPSLIDVDIRAVVNPVYEFTLPPNATVRYPNTQLLVGQFGVSDLLLLEDERLSIELVPGTMAARTNVGDVLPYTVAFAPPTAVDSANIGQSYSVRVIIDADAFDDATRTVYEADLVFQVRSQLSGEIIWRGTTTVTARKTQGGGGGDVDDDDDNGGVVVPDTGDNTVPDEQVPQAGPDTAGDTVQPGETIPPEEIPKAQPSGFDWWWIPVAALTALLLLLLILLWHNVSVAIYGRDSTGQETLLRTVRRLKGRHDEVVVSLNNRHIRGGVGGTVELTRAFTRRMRGKRLSVELEGIRLFSTVIPADAEGRFQTRIRSWIP